MTIHCILFCPDKCLNQTKTKRRRHKQTLPLVPVPGCRPSHRPPSPPPPPPTHTIPRMMEQCAFPDVRRPLPTSPQSSIAGHMIWFYWEQETLDKGVRSVGFNFFYGEGFPISGDRIVDAVFNIRGAGTRCNFRRMASCMSRSVQTNPSLCSLNLNFSDWIKWGQSKSDIKLKSKAYELLVKKVDVCSAHVCTDSPSVSGVFQG